MERAVDLNSDLGESFGAWKMGDDPAMFELVSSANIACGFHAGDPITMIESCARAVRHGVAVGAHVSYRDLAGFGRRDMELADDELYGDVLYQLSALQGIAHTVGTRVSYVKPHGALYNRIGVDAAQATVVARAVADFDPALPLLGLPDSEIARAAVARGLPYVSEAFVDRAYRADGSLVPRSTRGAVIDDPLAAARRAVDLVETGMLRAIDGTEIAVRAQSLCVHGDTAGAVAMARAVRQALIDAGVAVAVFGMSRA